MLNSTVNFLFESLFLLAATDQPSYRFFDNSTAIAWHL